MARERIQQKLIAYVQDAQAMERSVLMMLNSLIFSTSDSAMQAELRKHREETQQHEARLSQRLSSLGGAASVTKQATAVAPTLVKGLLDQVRGDKPANNARDGFITEHMEIATYELLERLAKRAGDEETAAAARANRADEERMARFISANWDRAMDLTLSADGVATSRPARGRRPAGATRSRTRSPRPAAGGSRSRRPSRRPPSSS